MMRLSPFTTEVRTHTPRIQATPFAVAVAGTYPADDARLVGFADHLGGRRISKGALHQKRIQFFAFATRSAADIFGAAILGRTIQQKLEVELTLFEAA